MQTTRCCHSPEGHRDDVSRAAAKNPYLCRLGTRRLQDIPPSMRYKMIGASADGTGREKSDLPKIWKMKCKEKGIENADHEDFLAA